MSYSDKKDSMQSSTISVVEVLVNSDRFVVGRWSAKGRVNYELPPDDITVSTTQFVLCRLSQGYFIKCISKQFPTKLAISSSPFLLRNGMIIDLGSPFSAVIRMEVFMPTEDHHFDRKYHDYFRFVRAGEYSSRLSNYNREVGKFHMFAKDFKKSSSTGNLDFRDSHSIGETADCEIEKRVDRVWDDLGQHYPPMVLKITKGREHFKDPIARKGWLILNMTDTHTFGRMPNCAYKLDTNLIQNHTMSIKFDPQRGWILKYLKNRDTTVGAFLLLKNVEQLKNHNESDLIKLYQGMQIVAGYHMFEVTSLLEHAKS